MTQSVLQGKIFVDEFMAALAEVRAAEAEREPTIREQLEDPRLGDLVGGVPGTVPLVRYVEERTFENFETVEARLELKARLESGLGLKGSAL